MANRTKTLWLAGKKVKIEPMKARAGLEAIIKLAGVIKQAVPYLVLLGDPSPKIRLSSLATMLNEIEEIPDAIFEVVALGTELSRTYVEEELTTGELAEALLAIMKVNEWEKLWRTAHSLKVIDKTSIVDFAIARFREMRVR